MNLLGTLGSGKRKLTLAQEISVRPFIALLRCGLLSAIGAALLSGCATRHGSTYPESYQRDEPNEKKHECADAFFDAIIKNGIANLIRFF